MVVPSRESVTMYSQIWLEGGFYALLCLNWSTVVFLTIKMGHSLKMDSKMCFKTAPDFWLQSLSKCGGSLLLFWCCVVVGSKATSHNVTPAEPLNGQNQGRLLWFLFQNRILLSDWPAVVTFQIKWRIGIPQRLLGIFASPPTRSKSFFWVGNLGENGFLLVTVLLCICSIIQASTLHWSTSQLFFRRSFSLHLDLVLEMC